MTVTREGHDNASEASGTFHKPKTTGGDGMASAASGILLEPSAERG